MTPGHGLAVFQQDVRPCMVAFVRKAMGGNRQCKLLDWDLCYPAAIDLVLCPRWWVLRWRLLRGPLPKSRSCFGVLGDRVGHRRSLARLLWTFAVIRAGHQGARGLRSPLPSIHIDCVQPRALKGGPKELRSALLSLSRLIIPLGF